MAGHILVDRGSGQTAAAIDRWHRGPRVAPGVTGVTPRTRINITGQ